MAPLPRRLVARLHAAGAGIVAPVGVGLDVDALRRWATASGRDVVDGPPQPGRSGWLWCPSRRRELARLPADHADALVLADDDLLLDADDWAAALPEQTAVQAAATWAATGGWPAALPIARARPGDAALHLHPLATARIGPLLPPQPLLAAAERLAVAAALTASVADAVGVARADVDALHDGGWLRSDVHGWSFPDTLRRVLCPHPDPAAARRAADALADAGQIAAALQTLADAACWADYLALLATTARAGQGEAALRAALRPLPERWRSTPPALYVAGLVARAGGDLAAAASLYTRAIDGGLDAAPQALAHNARGVVRAMLGDVEPALADFDAATRSGGRTAGEAAQNRASLLVQLGRHADAERSLQVAITAFREAGDLLREVRSLETLASLHYGRGLLREAVSTYRTALGLVLPEQPPQAVLTHLNLAECHLALGDRERVDHHLGEAERIDAAHGPTAHAGWVDRLRALVRLGAGQPAQALADVATVRSDDRTLAAELALVRCRALRELGDVDAAMAALDGARSLGLRADLEAALLDASGLDALIDAARDAQARVELAIALLRRAQPADLDEALELIRGHGYGALLASPAVAPLAARAADDATRALFPLRVQLYGPLRLTHAGRSVVLADFPTRKSAALLVAVALSRQPQTREQLAERFWPGAKNPLASLQTAVYHLRSTFGAPVVGSERGVLQPLFPVHSDVADVESALQRHDVAALSALLGALPAPPAVLPDLPADLGEERAHAERVLHDALRAHADAQPALHADRRDALRILVAVDAFDTDSREELIRWHESHGEAEQAELERRRLRDARAELGVGG